MASPDCRAEIGDEFTLSLANNSHNWRRAYTFPCQKCTLLVSPFTLPRLSLYGEVAEIRNEFPLSIAKSVFALFVPPLSNGASRATSDRNPRQMIKSCPQSVRTVQKIRLDLEIGVL